MDGWIDGEGPFILISAGRIAQVPFANYAVA